MNTQSNDIRTHFGLNALPFTREFAVDSRWCHPSFDEPLQELLQTVEQRMSAAIIGPAGSGKTVLLRALHDRLPEARYRVTYIKVTQLGKRDFCREIARAIGCQPAGQYNVLVRRIQEHVSHTSASEGLRPLLLVDEAHDMAPETLAILRILTNFRMDSELVLSVILAGQPLLGRSLEQREMAAVAGRLSHVVQLKNLRKPELRAYVEHRLTQVGARKPLFEQMALDALLEIARGNLRATDTLALKALNIAMARQAEVVEHEHVSLARTQVLA